MKNLMNLNGAKVLNKKAQKSINGGRGKMGSSCQDTCNGCNQLTHSCIICENGDPATTAILGDRYICVPN